MLILPMLVVNRRVEVVENVAVWCKKVVVWDGVVKNGWSANRPFSYSTIESGSSDIFIHFYTRGSIEWFQSFYQYCAHSKILQNVMK